MNIITQVSEITWQDCADYLHLDEPTASEQNTLKNMINIAKTYIQKYTGRENLDDFPDFVIVMFVLVQDMWDNRALYVDKSNINHVVDSILSLHAVNLL